MNFLNMLKGKIAYSLVSLVIGGAGARYLASKLNGELQVDMEKLNAKLATDPALKAIAVSVIAYLNANFPGQETANLAAAAIVGAVPAAAPFQGSIAELIDTLEVMVQGDLGQEQKDLQPPTGA